MIGLSPKGVLEAVVVFPMMGIIALALDIICLILIFVGLDDFGILDIIGFAIFGTWIFIRSGEEKELGKAVVAPPTLKERKVAVKKGIGLVKRLGRVGLKAGIVTILEFIPYLGVVLFGWTALVIFEFISDLRSFSLEAGE